MSEHIKHTIGTVTKVHGLNYIPFGKLVDFYEEGLDKLKWTEEGVKTVRVRKYLVLVNEQGDLAKKSSIYSSYGTSLDKVKQYLEQEIILITSDAGKRGSTVWYSDLIDNKVYSAKMYDDDGNIIKNDSGQAELVHHDLLCCPRLQDAERPNLEKTVHELIREARIQLQQNTYWVARRAKYDFGDAEKLLAIQTEEQENIKPADRKKLDKAAADVKEAVETWVEADKPRVFKIDNHFRQHMAMRYGVDVFEIGKIEVDVSMYADSNYIVGNIFLPNKEPFECIMGVMADKGTWIATTVRPIKHTKTWYRLEKHKRKNEKNQKQSKQFWFDVYQHVSEQIEELF